MISEFITNPKAPHLTSIIKHNNPCGLASGKTPQESIQKAWQSDEVSAFGSIIAHNKKVNLDFVKFLLSPEILLCIPMASNWIFTSKSKKEKILFFL